MPVPVLSDYLKSVQGWLRDRSETYMALDDLTSYINRARREIAERTQCLRVLTEISGSIYTIEVTSPGSGYTNPTVVISEPDFPSGAAPFPAGQQATAAALVVGGQIASIGVTQGGAGYFQPTVTITDPTGTGAAATATISPISNTQGNQEVYRFSDVPLSSFAGIDSIFAVKSVSFIYANYRYSLPCYDFSTYQAFIRQYPNQYMYVPAVCAQYGQGTNGSLYMYPIASTIYQFEWDCFCLPQDLTDDGSYEPIPMPWCDAVPLGALVYAFEELQNFTSAKYYQDKFDGYVHRYSAWARPGRTTNPYGRY